MILHIKLVERGTGSLLPIVTIVEKTLTHLTQYNDKKKTKKNQFDK